MNKTETKKFQKKIDSYKKMSEKQCAKGQKSYEKLIRLNARKSERKSEHTKLLQQAIKDTTAIALRLAQQGAKWDSATTSAFEKTYAEFILGAGFKFEKKFTAGIPIPTEVPVFYGYSFPSACKWLALGKIKFNSLVVMALKQLSRGASLEQSVEVYDVPSCIFHGEDMGLDLKSMAVEYAKTSKKVERCDILQRNLNEAAMDLAKIITERELLMILDEKGQLLPSGYQWIWQEVQTHCKEKFMQQFISRIDPLFAKTIEVKILYVPAKKSKLGSRFLYRAELEEINEKDEVVTKHKRVLVPEATDLLFDLEENQTINKVTNENEY